ncbi:MAG: type II toxin-antitoxin system PemK/MazF family toxin [Actinomycetota bacterium]|nr:type II toxin-antitoxin system PemK/MazF family toxin [Actinomycetota bacterium]
MVRTPLRGEVYWVRLDPVEGSEQGGRRPVLIVQNDIGNRLAPTTIVAPLTRRAPRRPYPFLAHVTGIPGAEESWIHCGQVRTIDKTRLSGEPMAALDRDAMARVEAAVRASLGMY